MHTHIYILGDSAGMPSNSQIIISKTLGFPKLNYFHFPNNIFYVCIKPFSFFSFLLAMQA